MALALVIAAGVGLGIRHVRSGGGDHHHARAGGTPPGPSAERIRGPLHTEGERLVDSSGATVRLLGVDEPGMIAGTGAPSSEPDSCGNGWHAPAADDAKDMRAMGFNSVRLGVSWANLEPQAPVGGRHIWNQAYLVALDQAIHRYQQAGIAVVLDLHQNNMSPAFRTPKPDRCEGAGLPAWLYPDTVNGPAKAQCDFFAGRGGALDGYVGVWKMLAARYAHEPAVVAADLFNEPRLKGCRDVSPMPAFRRMAAAVHGADPRLLVIYQDNPARRGKNVLKGPLKVRNAVYSFHLYPTDWTEGKRLLEEHLARAQQFGQPLWVGEFGAFRQHGRGAPVPASWPDQLRSMMAWTKQHNVSWAFHQFRGGGSGLIGPHGLRAEWLGGLRSGF